MVCQLCLLVDSLGLTNPPRTGFTLVKSRIKKKRRREQGDCRYKMVGFGFPSVSKLHAQICNVDRGNLWFGCARIATKKMAALRIATISGLNL
jgi:hypothetical protein